MRSTPFLLIILLIMLAVDFYIYFTVRTLIPINSYRNRTIFTFAYWTISVSSLAILLLLPYFNFTEAHKLFKNTLFALVVALFFAKVVALLFFFVDDVRRVFQWMVGKLFHGTEAEGIASGNGEGISRSAFLTWMGVAIGGSTLLSFIYGFSNKYNYEVRKVKLNFKNLPSAFKGFKIVQLSDIHNGSFTNKEAVNKGIDKILALKPDMILFTGDLVNNVANEMQGYEAVFSRLRAPLGVYSVLGNHDYGDYAPWPSAAAKENNLAQLKKVHQELGWRLLLDENVAITKGEQSIGLVGVENISGKARFHSYGNLGNAMNGANYPFYILMSHDPSHWDSEVIKKYPQIDLTLSGHTHGMQFGVEIPGFRWSPVQYVYNKWAGLYEENNQKLYVNRGFGFIGYPGRVGILPEITLIELDN